MDWSTQPSEQVYQVRYRTMMNRLALFFATEVEPKPNELIFRGCLLLRTVTLKGTGLSKSYGEPIDKPVAIPNALEPVVIEMEKPVWWDVSREEAITDLRELENDPIALELGRKLMPARNNLYQYLKELNPIEAARAQSLMLTGIDLDERTAETLQKRFS